MDRTSSLQMTYMYLDKSNKKQQDTYKECKGKSQDKERTPFSHRLRFACNMLPYDDRFWLDPATGSALSDCSFSFLSLHFDSSKSTIS